MAVCAQKSRVCLNGYGDRKSGIETVNTLKKRISGLFLISGYERIYTYLGVSHFNSYGSPQTSTCPFHSGHELIQRLFHDHLLQGSVTNTLKERAEVCTRPFHRGTYSPKQRRSRLPDLTEM